MSKFLRLLDESDKAVALSAACAHARRGEPDPSLFDVLPESFDSVPGKPFAYWVSEPVRQIFRRFPPFETSRRSIRVGDHPGDGFRFLRLFWEVETVGLKPVGWAAYQKGGAYSPFYADIHLVAYWNYRRDSYEGFFGRPGRTSDRPSNFEHFFRPGLTWPRRTQGGLSVRAMPSGCIFADKGPAAFVANNDHKELLALLALSNSRAFRLLVSLQMSFGSYEVGVIQKTPIPSLSTGELRQLAALAHRAWSQKRTLDTVTEVSHAFSLPAALRARLGEHDPRTIEAELKRNQAELDAIAFDLYGFAEIDRVENEIGDKLGITTSDDEDGDDTEAEVASTDALLSWAVGVAFGRFDWRLATGEREAPPEPEPFDPLPAKSPGMLPDGAEPFHVHTGILVDDPGHSHDLARLVEEVLERVEMPIPSDVRRWLQREFFAFHLQHYSKSRRKAPIYWPLSTPSGSYTLWLYYPSLSSQTLYTAVNDFVEPKLKQIKSDVTVLLSKGARRSRDDEEQFESLQTMELELVEMRDTLLKIAQSYHPNHDDGVQITAAPLWPLFRHKPWQKVLKDTWAKLERGEYDWANLAMNYWPDRIREKCKTDKSLAIAHNMEGLGTNESRSPTRIGKRIRSKR